MLKKLGNFLLISSSIIAATALIAIGYKKLADSIEMLNFDNCI